MAINLNNILTVHDVASLLDVHPESVRRLFRQEKIDGRLIGNTYIFEPEYIARYAELYTGKPGCNRAWERRIDGHVYPVEEELVTRPGIDLTCTHYIWRHLKEEINVCSINWSGVSLRKGIVRDLPFDEYKATSDGRFVFIHKGNYKFSGPNGLNVQLPASSKVVRKYVPHAIGKWFRVKTSGSIVSIDTYSPITLEEVAK